LGGFGHVLDHPEWWVVRLNEEHGILASRDGGPISAAIGERLRIIPNHICTAVNLHARAVLVDGEHLLKTIAIAAQGGIH
jgi:D-serine deaminase-like pyridoxal phosphate-dependent protein